MSQRSKQKALFLDRDGVLITHPFLTWQKKQMRLTPGIGKLIARFNREGIPVLVITNQPVVARGLITEAGVRALHEMLNKRLKRVGARIDAFYFCPHHPNADLKKYRMVCPCRKPAPGMFFEAAKARNIDLKKSVMIGDQGRDILAANRAGVISIFVKDGFDNAEDARVGISDYQVPDTVAALRLARKILKK